MCSTTAMVPDNVPNFNGSSSPRKTKVFRLTSPQIQLTTAVPRMSRKAVDPGQKEVNNHESSRKRGKALSNRDIRVIGALDGCPLLFKNGDFPNIISDITSISKSNPAHWMP